MKYATAPFFRSNICKRFSKVPTMTVEVLRIVLAFTVGLIFRFRQYDGSVLSCAFGVSVSVVDAN